MSYYYSNGKLLLTSEYLVLDGATALALPTKLGQALKVETNNEPILHWRSIDKNGGIWFEERYNIENNDILPTTPLRSDQSINNWLIHILKSSKKLNSEFLNSGKGFTIETKLDFPINWGLGSSSTLINNIAKWAYVDPYELLKLTFGGSGYDIACALSNGPITYNIENGKPTILPTPFKPIFKDNLYFVHLNKKQDSREGIAYYKANRTNFQQAIYEANNITSKLIICETLSEFDTLINQHEQLIAKVTNQLPVKKVFFDDFTGNIKSLGAWGGDFILATCETNPSSYFITKGYNTVIPYSDIIL